MSCFNLPSLIRRFCSWYGDSGWTPLEKSSPQKNWRNPKFHHFLSLATCPIFRGPPIFSCNKVVYGGPRDYIIENPNPEVFSDAEHLALGLMSSDRIMRLKPRLKNKYDNYCKIILDTTNNTKFQIPDTPHKDIIYIYIYILIYPHHHPHWYV